MTDDPTLIATELATNALRHGATPARASLALCELKTGRQVVCLEIEDSAPGFNVRTTATADAERCSGRAC
ncbi:hypothetical protein ACFWOG_40395 [Kitasatospora sp. NPDC058406]|uniref:hypothetical protein n=1 Tax=Kitasatospora sp. NPDC058406 TaxID=3346483 RepID=UPI00365703C2